MERVEKYLTKRLKETNLNPVDRQAIEGLLVVTNAYNSEKDLEQPKPNGIIGPHTPDQLAKAVNEACGGQLPDEVTLHSLFFLKGGTAGEEAPEKWVQCFRELRWQEVVKIKYPLGAAMRGLRLMMDEDNKDTEPTLGDLRATSPDNLRKIKQISLKSATFLSTLFKRQESVGQSPFTA